MTAPHPLAPEQRAVTLRDLAGLLASLVLVAAPHALRMPWWLTLVVLGLYAWRARIALEGSAPPSRWLVLGLALLAIGAVYFEYRTLFGRTSGIVLLVLFSGLKLAEMRTHRDAAVVAFLGYFLVMTNLLYTQSIPTALLMALALLAITGTLVGLAAPQRPAAANLRSAGVLLAHAAPAARETEGDAGADHAAADDQHVALAGIAHVLPASTRSIPYSRSSAIISTSVSRIRIVEIDASSGSMVLAM